MAPSRNFRNILEAIIKYPPSASDAQALIGVLERYVEPQLPFPSYSVTVNYDQTVEQLVKAGKYTWSDSDVTSGHFPFNKKGEEQVEIFIVSIDRRMSDPEVTQFINSWGLQDVNVKEELSLGAQYPDLQREGPIVGRGSTWRVSDGDLVVPYLFSDGGYRRLGLVRLGGGWSSNWQFACKRK